MNMPKIFLLSFDQKETLCLIEQTQEILGLNQWKSENVAIPIWTPFF